MIIAVDAAGGDYAPHEIVRGAIKAAEDFKVGVALVGKPQILSLLTSRFRKQLDITIIPASDVITYYDHPIEAIQKKPDSSTVVGIKLIKAGKAQAFVSAGNAGACLAASFFILGKISKVDRPSLCSLVNLNPGAPSLLLDVGVNVDCRPAHLEQFAELGVIYAKKILDIPSPRVGLMNIGEEETKGSRLALEAYSLLKNSGLNFIGNIEGHDLTRGKADVIVTDGFTGNVIIKTIEGLADSFIRVRRPEQTRSPGLTGGALAADVGMNAIIKGMDFREYGGATLLGVNGNVIVAHGRSRAKAIRNAVGIAIKTADSQVDRAIAEEIREIRE